jgi:hypothetical protein
MTVTIINGRAEDRFKPAPHYAEVAAACRAMGMDISNDDYEQIDAMLESNSMWAALPNDPADDLLVAGYTPHSGMLSQAALAN